MLCDVDLSFPDATRTHSVEVARGFVRSGLEVDLVARGADPDIPGVGYTPADGAEAQKIRRLVTINLRTIALLWRRRRAAARFYVRDSWSCTPSIAAARALGYRIVLQVDGIPYGGAAEGGSPVADAVKRALAILAGRLSTGQLAVTPQIKHLLVTLAHVSEDRIEVIPNGVDLEFFRPLPREDAIARLDLDPDRRYLVFCGGFNPWSDFELMLTALAQVRASRPEVVLLLVGDGPERPAIERTIRELNIADAVQITGMLPDRGRVRDYLAAASITLLAYRPERVGRTSASPIKLTEYLAMGRAVVAVEIDGVRGLVEETGAGRVVPDEPPAMSQAILELLHDGHADRCGAAGRAVAEERLSWSGVISRTLTLFDR
jgi:glycosyltransferase involved in cell wall biosynthesis